jgi:hypothetical protein
VRPHGFAGSVSGAYAPREVALIGALLMLLYRRAGAL